MNEHKLASIGQLVAGIVHNLKNPLNVILGYAGLLKMDVPEAAEKCNQIIGAADNMTRIIQNILDKSRDEQSMEMKSLNLNKVLTDELNFLQADPFFKHRVEKVVELDESLPQIAGIYSDFSQSFSNIIRNALDAMHKTDRKGLTVKGWYENDYIFIKIEDTGEGISEDNLKHIFEPYFSTKPAICESKEGEPAGTGLGLFMVQTLLKKYNPEYDIRSRPGEGTSFIIKIPVQKRNTN